MKKVLSALAVSLLATSAFAETAPVNSGTVAGEFTFNSELRQSTCKLAQDSVNQTVTIPFYMTEGLKAPNSVSPREQKFGVTLVGCPASYKDKEGNTFGHATMKFASSDLITDQGTLKNTVSTKEGAENVQLRILNDQGQPVDLKNNTDVTKAELSITKDSVILPFAARLESKEGGATAGKFASNVGFSIDYK